ncbi:MAG: carboxypeptidase-like regulatory domain-containing protein [Edaphobacter sp.]
MSTPRPTLRPLHHPSTLLFTLLLCSLLHPALAQQTSGSAAEPSTIPTPEAPAQPLAGAITGTITDQDGDSIPSAQITLSGITFSGKAQPLPTDRQAASSSNGDFSFADVTPGSFQLTVTAPGFATRQTSGSLQPGQQAEIPQIILTAATSIGYEVTVSRRDIAQDQIAEQEQQRVLGVIPNFYVSYVADPAPLVPRQKFELAWKVSGDPINFAMSGLIAGIQQSQNTFGGYGQGTHGFAKRFGATYADGFIGTMLSNAILPALFKQDPRYFYKGSGNIASRILYALASAVICKGDNGHWQANYSNITGTIAAAGISNLYYPPADRNGIKLTFEDSLIGLAANAGGNLFQEFLIPRLTPHAHLHAAVQP